MSRSFGGGCGSKTKGTASKKKLVRRESPTPHAPCIQRRHTSHPHVCALTSAYWSLMLSRQVIRPFKEKPKLPENYEDDSWYKLQMAIDAVAAKQPYIFSREELYGLVENLCIHKMAARLYQRLHDECERHAIKILDALLAQSATMGSDELFLDAVTAAWQDFYEMMYTIRAIFLYLDRSYVIQTPGLRSIWDFGLEIFRAHLRRRRDLELKLAAALQATVEREWRGEAVNHMLLKTVLRMLSALKVYDELFALPFLREAELFFAAEGISMLEQCSTSHFLEFAEQRLAGVGAAVVRYLDPATRKPLTAVIEQQLLRPHTQALLDKGLDGILDAAGVGGSVTMASSSSSSSSFASSSSSSSGSDGHHQGGYEQMRHLRRMWNLFQRVGALEQLRVGFNAYAKRAGAAIIATRSSTTSSSGSSTAASSSSLESPDASESQSASANGGNSTTASSRSSRDKELISELLALKDRLDLILQDAFAGARAGASAQRRGNGYNKGVANGTLGGAPRTHRGSRAVALDRDTTQAVAAFRASLKEAFEFIVNEEGANAGGKARGYSSGSNRLAELMAKFADAKLRGEKGVSESQVEAQLERLMTLFRFVHAKDVFEAFYKKDLAKRLILNKSSSIDLERSMVLKLKVECGANFTNKLEGMFKDVDLSQDIMKSYLEHRAEKNSSSSSIGGDASGPDTTVQVLTTGYWPTYPSMEVKLPASVAAKRDHFSEFYLSKYHGRRLAWQHSLSHCIVRAWFPKGRKELEVSLFQTLVLLCFNHQQHAADGADLPIRFTDILAQTSIEKEELKRTLQSLACGKVRVLTKDPKGKEVVATDVFRFNADFKENRYRIKINSVQLKETAAEQAKVNENVARDRGYSIDAAIVRIMKARKVMTHNLLISEVLAQLVFPSGASDVKKRIESLIEREYLERDADSSSTYKYLA